MSSCPHRCAVDPDCPSSRPICTGSPYAATLRQANALTRDTATVSAKVEQLAAQAAARVLLVSTDDEADEVAADGKGLEVTEMEDGDDDDEDEDDDNEDDDEDGEWCMGLLAAVGGGGRDAGWGRARCLPLHAR